MSTIVIFCAKTYWISDVTVLTASSLQLRHGYGAKLNQGPPLAGKW
jgi:hypothetical protein